MSAKPRSVRQAQALQTARLRELGRSWAEIAAIFQRSYRVNPRVALRQAHGWSQPQAAANWTARWPDDPKTFKNFSYWEQWPGQTGHAPSLDTLDRLAQLYECKITDLLADCDDYSRPLRVAAASLRPRERAAPAGGSKAQGERPPWPKAELVAAGSADISAEALGAALEAIRQAQLSEPEAGEADGPGRRLRRRTLLLDASSALAVLAAAPMLEVPRLAAASRAIRCVDHVVVGYTSEVVAGLRRLALAVGPRITLQPAMALRSAMAALARSAPEAVTSDALTAYGDLTLLIGWLMFHLGDHKAARYYYDDARAAAYRADNQDLATYALGTTSYLALAVGRSKQAIEHAQAARQAAKASGNLYALGYAADILARAYASAGQVGRCRATLDQEQDALSLVDDSTPRSSWWCFYDRSFCWGTESECALKLGLPVDALDAARNALTLADPQNVHAKAIAMAFSVEALIKQDEIAQACDTLANMAKLATMHSSTRIARQVDSLRVQLRVADGSAEVRELDDKLAEYLRARAAEAGAGLSSATE